MSDPGLNGQQDGIQPLGEPQMVSPGARLAAYRKERGWTVEQVASQLNLAPRQIAAIESDDYPSLPGMPIVRGFIRAYAKLLKVDAAPLLATLGGETVLVHDSIEPRKTLSTPFSEARLPTMMERQGLSSKWVVGVLVAMLIGVAIWAARHEYSPAELSKAASSQGSDTSQAPSTELSGAQAETPKEQPGITPSPAAPVPAGEVPSAVAETSPTAAPAPSVVVPPVVQAQPATVPEAAASAGKDTLEFKAREDSWIEVRRVGNNAVLLSRIVRSGERESIDVNEPVSVVIGNAAGVDLTLRGAPVEMKPKTNSNVARLNLK